MADTVVRFLEGLTTDGRGRQIIEILDQDDWFWENTHDFIQWLFGLNDVQYDVPAADEEGADVASSPFAPLPHPAPLASSLVQHMVAGLLLCTHGGLRAAAERAVRAAHGAAVKVGASRGKAPMRMACATLPLSTENDPPPSERATAASGAVRTNAKPSSAAARKVQAYAKAMHETPYPVRGLKKR